MSIEGFTRARLRAWEQAIGRLASSHAVCLGCGGTMPLSEISDGKTPCCDEDFLQGQNTADATSAVTTASASQAIKTQNKTGLVVSAQDPTR